MNQALYAHMNNKRKKNKRKKKRVPLGWKCSSVIEHLLFPKVPIAFASQVAGIIGMY
jgi:hypothetical protein